VEDEGVYDDDDEFWTWPNVSSSSRGVCWGCYCVTCACPAPADTPMYAAEVQFIESITKQIEYAMQVRNYPVQFMGLTANHKKTTKEHADT
jgi:hypothetical protein